LFHLVPLEDHTTLDGASDVSGVSTVFVITLDAAALISF
jgi:hypothetical protein